MFLKASILFIGEDKQGKEVYVHKNAQSKKVRNGLRDLNSLIHAFFQTQHVHGVYFKSWYFSSHMNVCIENMVPSGSIPSCVLVHLCSPITGFYCSGHVPQNPNMVFALMLCLLGLAFCVFHSPDPMWLLHSIHLKWPFYFFSFEVWLRNKNFFQMMMVAPRSLWGVTVSVCNIGQLTQTKHIGDLNQGDTSKWNLIICHG